MKTAALCLYLATAIGSFAQVIDFTTNEEGNIVVNGYLDDTIPSHFIFDTGGGLNVISNKFFQRLKGTAIFQHYYTGFRHDGDRLDLKVYKIPSLSLGGYKIKNVLVGVTSILDEWNIDGIVSLINFRTVPVTIDYKQKQLRIETRSSATQIVKTAQSLPIKLHEFDDISIDIFVAICINGHSFDMEFDTGSMMDDILVNSKFISSFGIDTSKTKNSDFITPFTRKPFRRFVATMDSAQYCGLQHDPSKKVRIDFRENMIYEGIIGAGYFHDLPFTIDIANKRILVQAR